MAVKASSDLSLGIVQKESSLELGKLLFTGSGIYFNSEIDCLFCLPFLYYAFHRELRNPILGKEKSSLFFPFWIRANSLSSTNSSFSRSIPLRYLLRIPISVNTSVSISPPASV